jgi:hypothetical protein
MDSIKYTEIIYQNLDPFVRKTFNSDVELHQDNDPKHNSIRCRAALDNNDINWVKKFNYLINYNLILKFYSIIKRSDHHQNHQI